MKEKALPEGWVETTLADVVKIVRGVSYKKEQSSNEPLENYLPILRANNIKDEYLNFDELVYVQSELIKAEQKIKKNDVLVAMSSGSKLVVGKTARAEQNIEMGFGVFCAILRPNTDIEPKLVSQFTQSAYYRSEISRLSAGGTINNLKPAYFKEIIFPLPPLETQQKLAKKFTALLSQVAEIKQRLEKIPALLKTYRQSVLARAVNGELSAKWREENGVSLESWNKAKIHNLGSIFSGKTPSKKNPCYWENGTVYWVSAKDMKFDEITFSSDLITEKAVNETKLKICPTDTILMVMRSGIIAHTFPVALTKVEVTINQDLKALRPKKGFAQPKFIFYLLKGNEQKILEKCSKAGTTVASIEMPEFEKFVFDIPSLEEQNYITQAVEKHLNFANQLEAQVNAALERVNLMTQAILAKGFRGELL
ncbi:restriction endonuclease subunit S [Glaesserella parasuis]|uniref:restriction endonuclease subunit S n=1 Tax=Glaesserella parasuis TaxID=738 RepID=UPI00243701E2|nr:restriction endonuclease subunit S [Glaesserella parasuis]MDG6449650.1 restriction endonuclease subunit S [Glaesserella parasuis]MDO9790654.1 restriction endonuclease subunit S [Glaesserella parasuis]